MATTIPREEKTQTPASAIRVVTRRRTISVRTLVATIVVVALALPALYFLREWQLARTATAYLNRADALEKEGKWLDAADYIGRFRAVRPDDVEAEIRLAETFAKGATTVQLKGRAAALYYAALGNNLGDRQWPLREQLTRLLLETGRFPEAETESRKILAHDVASLSASKSLALALFGRAEAGSLNGVAQAELKKLKLLDTMERARKAHPKDIKLASSQAAFLRRHPDLVKIEQPKWGQEELEKKAKECLVDLVAADPTNPDTHLARFFYRQRFPPQGDPENAVKFANTLEDDIAKALELGPKNASVLAAAGSFELSTARALKSTNAAEDEVRAHAAQAVTHFKSLISEQPEAGGGIHLALGESQMLLDKPDDAIATWTAGLKRFADDDSMAIDFEMHLADAYLELNRNEAVQRCLTQVDKRIQSASARLSGKRLAAVTAAQDFLRARFKLQLGDINGAIPYFQRVAAQPRSSSSRGDDPLKAVIMLGQAYASIGQWREAAQSYDEACQRNPGLFNVRLAAAQSWLAAGQGQLATDRAEQSLSQRDSVEAWLTLSTAIFRQQLRLGPQAWDWTRFDMALGETAERNESLRQPWQVDLLRAESLIARGAEPVPVQQPTVQQILKDLEVRYPQDSQLWARLVLIWQRLKMPAEANRCLSYLRRLPDGKHIAGPTQINLFRMRNEFGEAEKALSKLVADSPARQRPALMNQWIDVKLAQNDVNGARLLLLSEHRLRPNDLTVLLQLVDLDTKSGQWDDVQNWEQKLTKLAHPAGLHADVSKVRRLLANSQSVSDATFVEAEHQLRRLRDRASSWGEVAALAGTVAQRRGDLAEAASHYTQAVKLGEHRLAVYENLIAVLERLGRLSEAHEYLQRLESLIPLSQSLTVLYGAVEMRLDDAELALTMARKAVEQRPQDVQAILWLARLLTLHKQYESAEAELKKARELAPQDMQVWTSLLLLHTQAKNADAAVELANQVKQQQNLPVADRHFLAAQAYDFAGKSELAERSFLDAAKAAPKNASIQYRLAQFYLKFDSQKAETYLEKVLEVDPSHRAARLTLALVLDTRGTVEDRARADSLLTGQSQAEDESVLDERLHAVVLIRRGGADNLARAQKVLEQLVTTGPKRLPLDQLLLAQVYERQALLSPLPASKKQGLDKAARELELLAASAQADSSHFVAVIEFFSRQQQQANVDEWMNRFQEWMTKQSKPSADSIVALVRLQLKYQASAKSGPWLDQLEAQKIEPLRTLLLRALWCSQQGQREDIRRCLDEQGESLLSLETTESGKTKILSGIANIYRELKQFEGVERWERRLVAIDPKRYEGLASILAQQGRWSEAVELCRQAAETDKTAHPAVVALSCLSSTQITNERFADCEPLIQSALENPNAELHYSLGVVFVMQNRLADAVAQFRKVIKANPRHVPALNNLALLLADEAETRKEARAMIDQAIDLAGMTEDLCDTKGAILLASGQTHEAIRFFEIATRGINVDPRFVFHLAVAYFVQNNLAQARMEFDKVDQKQLEAQILTDWDRRMLQQLRTSLNTSSSVSGGSIP